MLEWVLVGPLFKACFVTIQVLKFLRCLEVTVSLNSSTLVLKVEVEARTQVDSGKDREPQLGRREGVLLKRLAEKSGQHFSDC